MTPGKAKSFALVAAVGSGVFASIGNLSQGKAPSVRVFVGSTLAAMGLFTLAGAAPRVSVGFSTILLLTSLYNNGTPLFNAINKATGQTAPSIIPRGSAGSAGGGGGW